MDVCGIVYCKGIYRGSGHMSVYREYAYRGMYRG